MSTFSLPPSYDRDHGRLAAILDRNPPLRRAPPEDQREHPPRAGARAREGGAHLFTQRGGVRRDRAGGLPGSVDRHAVLRRRLAARHRAGGNRFDAVAQGARPHRPYRPGGGNGRRFSPLGRVGRHLQVLEGQGLRRRQGLPARPLLRAREAPPPRGSVAPARGSAASVTSFPECAARAIVWNGRRSNSSGWRSRRGRAVRGHPAGRLYHGKEGRSLQIPRLPSGSRRHGGRRQAQAGERWQHGARAPEGARGL